MEIFVKTDIGKVRDKNQDSYYVSKKDEKYSIAILADGMGGYSGGEIASKIATDTAKEYIENTIKHLELTEEEIKKIIFDAIQMANKAVYEKSRTEEELEEMGTTLEINLIYNNKMYLGHIGDSRTYILKNKELIQITKDHSYVEKLIADGTITEEEAINHPKKNMLIKAVGCNTELEPDIITIELEEKDLFLICSDGLTNMLNKEQIFNVLDNENILNKEVALVDGANNYGGLDNITVILIKI